MFDRSSHGTCHHELPELKPIMHGGGGHGYFFWIELIRGLAKLLGGGACRGGGHTGEWELCGEKKKKKAYPVDRVGTFRVYLKGF